MDTSSDLGEFLSEAKGEARFGRRRMRVPGRRLTLA
jgi:hypothetical protein